MGTVQVTRMTYVIQALQQRRQSVWMEPACEEYSLLLWMTMVYVVLVVFVLLRVPPQLKDQLVRSYVAQYGAWRDWLVAIFSH